MKKRTKILSLLSSFSLSASLFVNCPITHGYFEEAVKILKTNNGNLTTQQIDELKNTFRGEQASFQKQIEHLQRYIDSMSTLSAEISGSFSILRAFSDDLHVHMDPFNPATPLTNEQVEEGLSAMRKFGLTVPNYNDFVNLVNKVNEETVIYFPTLYQILQNPHISAQLQATKDLNILRKEIKKTIANNEEIKSALKLTITSGNGNEVEYEFTTDGRSWLALGSNLTMKNLAEAICNWNEKNPNSIKNWWVSRYEMTRNEIKKMAYDESTGTWEHEDKEVIDVLFMCLDSYVK